MAAETPLQTSDMISQARTDSLSSQLYTGPHLIPSSSSIPGTSASGMPHPLPNESTMAPSERYAPSSSTGPYQRELFAPPIHIPPAYPTQTTSQSLSMTFDSFSAFQSSVSTSPLTSMNGVGVTSPPSSLSSALRLPQVDYYLPHISAISPTSISTPTNLNASLHHPAQNGMMMGTSKDQSAGPPFSGSAGSPVYPYPVSIQQPSMLPTWNVNTPTTSNGTMTPPSHLNVKDFTLNELRPFFNKPLAAVAKELGVCITLMKKICRRNGLQRWPHRRIRSLVNQISHLQVYVANPHLNVSTSGNPSTDTRRMENQLQNLQQELAQVIQNPNIKSRKAEADARARRTQLERKRKQAEVVPSSTKDTDYEQIGASKKRKRVATDSGEEGRSTKLSKAESTDEDDDQLDSHKRGTTISSILC